MPEIKEVRDLFNKLRAEREAIAAKSAPLRAKRDDIVAQMQPLLDQAKALQAEIEAIERPKLYELDQTISGLARVLGGKRLSDNDDTQEQS